MSSALSWPQPMQRPLGHEIDRPPGQLGIEIPFGAPDIPAHDRGPDEGPPRETEITDIQTMLG